VIYSLERWGTASFLIRVHLLVVTATHIKIAHGRDLASLWWSPTAHWNGLSLRGASGWEMKANIGRAP
jgi:hypothetical protein